MIIALASPRAASSVGEGLDKIRHFVAEAAARGAEVVCFPEAYLPGLRGQDFDVPPFDPPRQEAALRAVAGWAREYAIAVVHGTERFTEAGRQIAAYVFDARGDLLGFQTKNQIHPTEERFYVPGDTRQLFEVNGTKFGVAICHEGWRYPETVRWAAVRGAKVVFHPQHSGSDRAGTCPTQWGAPGSPYYEKAMVCRAVENEIYFASANYTLRFPESATGIIAPAGECLAHLPYGQEGVLVEEVEVQLATGLYAARYAPERYQDAAAG